jgi:hypothetical protein
MTTTSLETFLDLQLGRRSCTVSTQLRSDRLTQKDDTVGLVTVINQQCQVAFNRGRNGSTHSNSAVALTLVDGINELRKGNNSGVFRPRRPFNR